MKVILNKCYGGFGISVEGYKLYAKKLGRDLFMYRNNYLNHTYVKVDGDSTDFGVDFFTIDLGETISSFDIPSEVWKNDYLYLNEEHRTDSVLIEVVEELGEKANGCHAQLKVVEIPDDMKYEITDYDGIETLHEIHRVW